jgi:N4-gp56 family major capsid protein
MGKKIKQYHYLPMLDMRNINDQGIDAAGAVLDSTLWSAWDASGTLVGAAYASEALAVTAAGVRGWTLQNSGYLYGSSKDIGTIAGRLPALSETGGYVNRVGFKRIEISGTIEKFGFYDEYTKESMDFDTDAEKQTHINREMLRGANEITEDMLQIDLINAAGVIRYAGVATSNAEITGVTADGVSEVDYDDLQRLKVTLDNNRCPKDSKIITGSRMVDTKVLNAARIMFIGSDLQASIERITDYFGLQAFIPATKYAAAGNLYNGEVGTVGGFRMVVVPEMMKWAGQGAIEGVNAGYQVTNGYYDVFPMLVVGSESFTTIGFETSGNMIKFKIKHSEPESPESYANDPFGETGFMSIKFYYGFMALRTERIALVKTVARV